MQTHTDESAPPMSGWVGWIVFGAVMAVLSGIFSAIWGIVGLVRQEFFRVDSSGNVIAVNYHLWGTLELVLGVIGICVGVALLTGSRVAQLSAIALATLNAVTHLLIISAFPVWSVLVIALDVMVVFAIAVHGRELQPASGHSHFAREPTTDKQRTPTAGQAR
jgi:hypothetical protein